jgi:hypothetical protein
MGQTRDVTVGWVVSCAMSDDPPPGAVAVPVFDLERIDLPAGSPGK